MADLNARDGNLIPSPLGFDRILPNESLDPDPRSTAYSPCLQGANIGKLDEVSCVVAVIL
jgi:hypothetical protein